MNHDVIAAINGLAVEALVAGCLPAEDAIDGVKALDWWHHGPNAGMLFWADEETDLMGTGQAVYYDVYLRQTDRAWQSSTGGMLSTESMEEPLAEPLADVTPGLHRFDGSSVGPVRMTWAVATPGVAGIRVVDRHGDVHERPPGRHGFVLLGTTAGDPITYAYAFDQTGKELPGEPLML